jgi:hypothetical protein
MLFSLAFSLASVLVASSLLALATPLQSAPAIVVPLSKYVGIGARDCGNNIEALVGHTALTVAYAPAIPHLAVYTHFVR